MPEKIRWGVLGCGRIARKFATDLQLVDDAILVAAGARSIESANAFAKDIPVLTRMAATKNWCKTKM